MIQQRKREHIPDISFDLDGDGVVGPRDFFIGKHFDEGTTNNKKQRLLNRVRFRKAEFW